MNAQLMGPAGDRLECQPGENLLSLLPCGGGSGRGVNTGGVAGVHAKRTPQYLPPGDRGLPFRIGLLPPAALGIEAAERHVNYALVLDRAAFDHSPVGLGNPAMLEQKAE